MLWFFFLGFVLEKLLFPVGERWNHVVHEDTECVIVWFKCVCVYVMMNDVLQNSSEFRCVITNPKKVQRFRIQPERENA